MYIKPTRYSASIELKTLFPQEYSDKKVTFRNLTFSTSQQVAVVCCDAVIAHINPCFYLNDLSKSSVSKTKIREASKCFKKDFESPKLVYANKASILSI